MTGLDRGPINAISPAIPPASIVGGVGGVVPPPGYILVPERPVVAQPGALSVPNSNIGPSPMSVMMQSLPQHLWPQPTPQQQPPPRRGGRAEEATGQGQEFSKTETQSYTQNSIHKC